VGFVEGDSLGEHHFWGLSPLTNATLRSPEEAPGEAYSALRFMKGQDLQTLSRDVGLTLGYLLGEPGFGFLTDRHLQTLSRELGLALGISAGEPGFAFHHRPSVEDCLVVRYSPRPDQSLVVGY